jgi:hypothetical protein
MRAVALGLYLDERLIAFQYGFSCGGRLCFYKSAHDDLLGIYAPGKMIKRELVRRCFGQGYRMVDFGIGYEDYKAEWTDEQESVQSILWAKKDILSQALFVLPYLKCILRDQMKKSRKIILFKRNGLGKVRYFMSPESLRALVRRAASSLRWQGAAAWLGDGPRDRRMMLPEASPSSADALQAPEYECGPAKVADVPALAPMMNLRPETIIRRFYRQQQCFTVKQAGDILCAAWVSGGADADIYDLYHLRTCPMEAVQALLRFILRLRTGTPVTLTLHRRDAIGQAAAQRAGFRDGVPEKAPETDVGRTERSISNAASNH